MQLRYEPNPKMRAYIFQTEISEQWEKWSISSYEKFQRKFN